MADIFISYARERQAFVSKIAAMLESFGWSVWWDRQLKGGDAFGSEINRELALAKCAIVVWCDKSVRSKWVRAEAAHALAVGRLVPVQFGQDVKPPKPFSKLHVIASGDHGVSDLRRELASAITKKIGAPNQARVSAMGHVAQADVDRTVRVAAAADVRGQLMVLGAGLAGLGVVGGAALWFAQGSWLRADTPISAIDQASAAEPDTAPAAPSVSTVKPEPVSAPKSKQRSKPPFSLDQLNPTVRVAAEAARGAETKAASNRYQAQQAAEEADAVVQSIRSGAQMGQDTVDGPVRLTLGPENSAGVFAGRIDVSGGDFEGDVFRGGFKGDGFTGLGIYQYSERVTNTVRALIYEGEIKDGVPHGFGVMTYRNGATYAGQWTRGRKQGLGVWRTSNGARYEGEWVGEAYQGAGVFWNADGSVEAAGRFESSNLVEEMKP